MKNGPWTVLERRRVYDNPWIDVTHHQVLTPHGEPGIYGTVSFRHLAIGVLPLTDDWHTWIVGQHRFPLDAYSWEIPEGGGKADESPLTAAQRELREETGLVAAHWRPILEMHLSNSVTDERAVAFIARGLMEGQPEPDATESLVVRKVPFADAYAMVQKGEITDALSVATILRVRLLQLEEPQALSLEG